MYYCPRCNTGMEKIRLDVYGCSSCGHCWLIHPYRAEKYDGRGD